MMGMGIKNLYEWIDSFGKTKGFEKNKRYSGNHGALADDKNITGAQKSDAIEYVVKPLDYDVLLKKIAWVLKSKCK